MYFERRKKMSKTSLLMILAIVSIAVLSGCSQNTIVRTGFLSDYSNLQEKSDSSLRYIDKSALTGYSMFIVDRVKVHFHGGAKAIESKSEGKLAQQDMEDLANYFHTKVVEAIAEAGFRVVYKPGPGVGRIRIAITDIEETNVVLAAIPQTRMITGAGVGGASMEFELIDSQTGRQIGAAVERGVGSRIPFTGLSDWGGAKAAIDNWAERVTKRLKEGQSR
jgi:hypothetical protein